jgi:hypothetical protein
MKFHNAVPCYRRDGYDSGYKEYPFHAVTYSALKTGGHSGIYGNWSTAAPSYDEDIAEGVIKELSLTTRQRAGHIRAPYVIEATRKEDRGRGTGH